MSCFFLRREASQSAPEVESTIADKPETSEDPSTSGQSVSVGSDVTMATTEPTGADKLNELSGDSAPNGGIVAPTNGLNQLTAQEMDMAELKVKIVCQDKNNQALKMELKCAELQVT